VSQALFDPVLVFLGDRAIVQGDYPRSVGSQSRRFASSRKSELDAVQSQTADLEVLPECLA
jgi:hypothetical protein